jgi:hypothetical protein
MNNGQLFFQKYKPWKRRRRMNCLLLKTCQDGYWGELGATGCRNTEKEIGKKIKGVTQNVHLEILNWTRVDQKNRGFRAELGVNFLLDHLVAALICTSIESSSSKSSAFGVDSLLKTSPSKRKRTVVGFKLCFEQY